MAINSRDRTGANSTPQPTDSNGSTPPSGPAGATVAIAPPATVRRPLATPEVTPQPATPLDNGGPPDGRPTGFWRTFESLRDPSYRWFFGSMFSYCAGMNIQMFI